MGRRFGVYWNFVIGNYKKGLTLLGLFLLQEKEVVVLVKRSMRYFVAAVQDFYNDCITELMNMGKGCTHPEECYVPMYLYPELFRKAAACNNIEWDEEAFLREMEYNKNPKYYCTNPLLKKIAESLRDNKRSGYKITECFNETKLKPETAAIILAACLFREGEYLAREWHDPDGHTSKTETDEVKENGLVIVYYLLFQTDKNMKINEIYCQNYEKIWEQLGLDIAERISMEELFVLRFFLIIQKLEDQMKAMKRNNKISSGISVYKNSIIDGIRNNVLDATRM